MVERIKTQGVNAFITPLGNFTNELVNQLCIATHIERSTTALTHTPTLLRTIRKFVKIPHKLIKNMNYLERDTIATINRAKKILDNDFSKTNIHILIAMWNSLQTAIEDMFVILLGKKCVREDIIEFDIPKRWKRDLVDETEEDNYRFLLSSWRTGGNHIVDYMERKLTCFDMGGEVSEQLTTGLIEMHAIRNCLVHRAGIADKKFTEQAPSLNFSVDQEIFINKQMLTKYYQVAGEYGRLLLSRIIGCKYFIVVPKQ